MMALSAREPNLVRNGNFKLQWTRAGRPDCWYPAKGAWEGEIIPLKIGQRYRLSVQFKRESKDEVLVRWSGAPPHTLPRTAPVPKFETRMLTPKDRELEFTGAETLGLLQVIFRGKADPSTACDAISLIPLEAK
jgi:hypothetical protein